MKKTELIERLEEIINEGNQYNTYFIRGEVQKLIADLRKEDEQLLPALQWEEFMPHSLVLDYGSRITKIENYLQRMTRKEENS